MSKKHTTSSNKNIQRYVSYVEKVSSVHYRKSTKLIQNHSDKNKIALKLSMLTIHCNNRRQVDISYKKHIYARNC